MSKKPLLVIFLTVFIDLIGFGIIIPLSTYLAKNYGATALDIGLLMTIYSLMQFLFSPFWGQLSDRVGRRPIILISLLGVGLSYILFGFAQNLATLYIARALAGFFGANISTAMAYIADVTDEKNRSKGMGLIGAAFGLGFVLGPFLGGICATFGEKLGQEAPFGHSFAAIVAATICLTNVVFAFFVLKESLDPNKRRTRASRLKSLFQYFGKPQLNPLFVTFFLCTFAMSQMEATSFLLVKERFNWSIEQASYGFAYIGVLIVFVQGYLIRKWLPKFGEKRLILMGLVVFSLGLAFVGLSSAVWHLAVSFTLLALGNGLLNPSLSGGISLSVGAEEQGRVMGVTQSLASMGRILGPAAGGWLYGAMGASSPFLAAGTLVGLVLVYFAFVQDKLIFQQAKESDPAEDILSVGLFQIENLARLGVPFFIIRLKGSDVPEISERANSVLDTATVVSLADCEAHVEKTYEDKKAAIMIVCQSGQESLQVAIGLKNKGYINVCFIEGGLSQLVVEAKGQ